MSEAQCPACRRVAMARTSSALIVSAVDLDPFPQAAGDPLLDRQERHHVDELVDLQVRQVILDLEDAPPLPPTAGRSCSPCCCCPATAPDRRRRSTSRSGAGAGHGSTAARRPSGDGRNRSAGAGAGSSSALGSLPRSRRRLHHLPERERRGRTSRSGPNTAGGLSRSISSSAGFGPGVEDRPHQS